MAKLTNVENKVTNTPKTEATKEKIRRLKSNEPKIKEKFRKRRNFKARHNIKTRIDENEQKKIKVDLDQDGGQTTQFDKSNTLVLPSKKRFTKKILDAEPVRLLSKKHKKRLQKIVDTKRKKADRGVILKELEELHAANKNLPSFTSLSSIQTLGRKKWKHLDDGIVLGGTILPAEQHKGRYVQPGQPGSLSYSVKRKRKEELLLAAKRPKPPRDPTLVTMNDVSSSECSSDEEDEITEVSKEANGTDEQKVNGNNESSDEDSSEWGENEASSDKASCQSGESEASLDDNEDNATSSTTTEVADQSSSSVVASTSKEADTAAASVTPAVVVTAEDRLPSTYVHVKRDPALAEARLQLPILSEEQRVMEAIKENPMVVIVGATGSGKTTQVPQFLYEAGFASGKQIIGVTEPRRVAAISMSERVGRELGLSGREVSYQIRFEGNTSPDTKIKFMTDGVLLKEFQNDKLLMKYSAIIIDEAHERSVYSDLLIGILSRVVPARNKRGKPLKLIVMSATLRVEDFTENSWLVKKLGGPPPVIKIDGRTFEVTVHYNKITEDDYAEVAYNKVCKIHRQLPEGAILIFLTGQQEVHGLCRKLRATFPARTGQAPMLPAYRRRINEQKERRKKMKEQKKSAAAEDEAEEDDSNNLTKKLLEVNLDEFTAALSVFPGNENEDDECGLDESQEDMFSDEEGAPDAASDDDVDLGDGAADFVGGMAAGDGKPEQPLHVLPLYSLLPSHRQKLVFETPPEGMRLVVVATNIAETSLTIPDVKYVVDCGKTKAKVFDKVTGVSMFHVTNCSQASADQRAGRAGRVAPGHCYRLFSSAVFNEYAKFAKPEILSRPIDDIVLMLKSLRLPVVNFPYPTPPEHVQIRQALKRLMFLGAVDEEDKDFGVTEEAKSNARSEKAIEKDTTRITALGKLMSSFPVAPRYAKMLCLSDQHGLWPYTIALVAALTVQEILVEMPLDHHGKDFDTKRSEWRQTRLSWSGTGQRRLLGDLMVLLRAVLEADTHNNSQQYCDQHGLRQKGLLNVRKLRRQLTNEVNMIVPDANIPMDPGLKLPSKDQCCAMRQLVLSGSVDRVARRIDIARLKEQDDKIKWKDAYRTIELEEPVFLPKSSVLRIDKPEWVAYQDIFESSTNNKMFMRGVTAVEPDWLSRLAPKLCTFSAPLANPAPYYDADRDRVMCYANATFGRADWDLPPAQKTLHPAGTDLYCRFAYHLLKGDVLDTLAPFAKYLVDIRTLLRPLGFRYQEQKDRLVRALKICDVSTKAKLLDVWSRQPEYLLRQYTAWLSDKSYIPIVKKIWPPIPKEKNEWIA